MQTGFFYLLDPGFPLGDAELGIAITAAQAAAKRRTTDFVYGWETRGAPRNQDNRRLTCGFRSASLCSKVGYSQDHPAI